MIQLQRLLFFISLLFTITLVNAQEKKGPKPKLGEKIEQELDTVAKEKQVFGIRFGVDITKPIINFVEDDYSGLEIVADARVYKDFYAAVEFGFDKHTTVEDYMNFTTEGSYFKIGANYNAYDNWVGMTNEIFVGFRYGVSFFDNTLNSYTPNMYGEYIIPDTVEANTKYSGLTAQWAEFIAGMKVETFKNLYMGFSISFKIMTSNKDPENFKNLYVPGFYDVSLNNMGFGFNYSLSYLIPYARK